jgi:anti-anti-sigma factor
MGQLAAEGRRPPVGRGSAIMNRPASNLYSAFFAGDLDDGARPDQLPSWPRVTIGRVGATVVVTLQGVLDASATEWLERVLCDLVDGQGNQSVIVDLRSVERVEEAVLALLVAISGRAAGRGGRVALHGASPTVVEELDRVGPEGDLAIVHERS